MQKIIIFGVGCAGRAMHRKFLKEAIYDVIGFIDNNDKIVGNNYKGLPIYSAKKAKELECDLFVISGVWVDEMEKQLIDIGIDKNKILILEEKHITHSTPLREKNTDSLIKRIDEYLCKNNIKYFISGSAFLAALRGKPLSTASDVDLNVTNYEDLVFLSQNLKNTFKDLDIKTLYLKEDLVTRKANEISRIAITNNIGELEDRAMIDIGIFEEYGDYRIQNYDNGKYIYMNNNIFDNFTRIKYKDFYINALAKYDEYLTNLYGKNYIEIPNRFSANSYPNLVDKQTLEKMYNHTKQ